MKKYTYLLFILIIFMASCKNKTSEPDQKQMITAVGYFHSPEDSSAILVADSVIYTVFIKNPDSLDKWRDYSLRYMQRDELVDMIFQDVYSGKLIAYSYRDWIYGDKVIIPVDSVKHLENLKNRVGQMEFVERWFYNPNTQSFYKQVLEITLAYELYDNNGQVRGYAPLFKVSFNEKDNKIAAK